jgi:CubicO group peptidase (beta-lactamase class C family)
MRILASFTAALALSLTFLAGEGLAETPTNDRDIIGLWAYHTSFPVGLEGELTISRHGANWRASIGGASANATLSGADIRLTFPNEGGAFRGSIDAAGRVLTGFWVRREMTDDPRYPFGATQAYVMPLALRRSGSNRWRADVRPLNDPFTLYLMIFRDNDGVLKAAFRNPEQNSHGPAMQLRVSRNGDALHFNDDPAQAESQIDATVRQTPERIDVVWRDLHRTISLTRATQQQTATFSARPPRTLRYVYREPPATHDGWRTARAGALGVDETALAAIVQRIIDVDPASARPWLIHSMAIAYRGRLILDEYFYGHDREEPHDTRSASKTFASVMLGGVMMRGANISPSTRVYDVMAPLGPFANPDPRKQRITLGHLLTHSAGFACDDNAAISPGSEDAIEADRTHPDWARVTLDLPMQYEPGAHYAYCSMNINLAGAVLTQATGQWLPALFDRTVAQPLQFGPYYWNLAANGEGYAGGGAFVRTRDFLKLGQAFLDGGAWNGRRIVTETWVHDSLAPHARISPATTGLQGDAFAENYWETDEGYAWHLLDVRSGERSYPAYFANGNGGQLLIVVPQFELAVMFTAGNYQQGLWNRERDDIVGGMIIPALRRAQAPS